MFFSHIWAMKETLPSWRTYQDTQTMWSTLVHWFRSSSFLSKFVHSLFAVHLSVHLNLVLLFHCDLVCQDVTRHRIIAILLMLLIEFNTWFDVIKSKVFTKVFKRTWTTCFKLSNGTTEWKNVITLCIQTLFFVPLTHSFTPTCRWCIMSHVMSRVLYCNHGYRRVSPLEPFSRQCGQQQCTVTICINTSGWCVIIWHYVIVTSKKIFFPGTVKNIVDHTHTFLSESLFI